MSTWVPRALLLGWFGGAGKAAETQHPCQQMLAWVARTRRSRKHWARTILLSLT